MDRFEETHRLGHWVHRVLLIGLILSGLLLTAGLISALGAGQPRPKGPPPPFGTVLRGAARGRSAALLDLGLLLLMATPVARVAILAIGWGGAREWRFLAVALTVLGFLGLSLMLGLG